MTDFIIRIVELTLGFLLIAVTLIFSNQLTNDIVLLLPLLALPIVFLGMFDWHPVKELAAMFATVMAKPGHSLKQFFSFKSTASAH